MYKPKETPSRYSRGAYKQSPRVELEGNNEIKLSRVTTPVKSTRAAHLQTSLAKRFAALGVQTKEITLKQEYKALIENKKLDRDQWALGV